MKFYIITLFPRMFDSPFAESIIQRAQKQGTITIQAHQLRDYATDKHHTTDDTPYGGGPGMVLKVDVVDKALKAVKKEIGKKNAKDQTRIVMLSASGERFTQAKAIELSKYENIILLCGHYEGFDHRVHEHLINEEISIGDYVLTGGEIPAMVLIDAVTRMVPGVIKEESIMNESFMQPTTNKISFDRLRTPSGQETNNNQSPISNNQNLQPTTYNPQPNFDYPVYTRPVEYKGWRVPEVLQNGNHAEIDKWRNEMRKK